LKLQKDIELIKEVFPKLGYAVHKKKKFIKGDIDICDVDGNYWDTFSIAVLIPEKYPFDVPILFELSEKIPREDKRHISKLGQCCVDIDHELLHWSKRGILISEFIKSKVYPFLANQLYYEEKGEYANGEYDHFFNGVKQFYATKLNLHDPKIIIEVINFILANKIPGRNDLCPCGNNKKFKHCHESSFHYLKSVDRSRLLKDLGEFNLIINKE